MLEAARGSIYDKNLNVVSSSVQSFDIGIRPNEVVEKKRTFRNTFIIFRY